MLSFIVQLSTKLVRFKIDRLIDRYVLLKNHFAAEKMNCVYTKMV